jgi:protein phosphatase
MAQGIVQDKYVLGAKSIVGDPRRKHEDRVFVGEIKRSDGESLILGIVADGVGSADRGARGAQLAIDIVKRKIQESRGDNIPDILIRAIKEANFEVYEDNQNSTDEGTTTLVVSVIFKDKCYVGNVGDSRAYWIQGGDKKRMLKITRDHSFYNIHGGVDPNSDDAGILVNAIGSKSDVYVDIGFYFKGDNDDEASAHSLGVNGIPIKNGDAIMLCSDGLIKSDPKKKTRYATDDEIIDALRTEFQPETAAIKVVSAAEGRRPDDNVSAVTIQCLSSEMRSQMVSNKEWVHRRQLVTRIVSVLFAFVALTVIAVLGFNLNKKPQVVYFTLTPVPTMTPTQPIDPGKARVDQVNGNGANVGIGQLVESGSLVFSGDRGVQIVVGEQNGKASAIYLFENSRMQLNFSEKIMPLLESGAVYVQPGSESAEVYFSNLIDAKATVSGSRMIAEIHGTDIWIYCFEGTCQLFVGDEGRTIPVGSKRVYRSEIGVWDESLEMTYDEKWMWNEKCNFCMFEIISTPTPTPTSSIQPRQTKKPQDDTYGSIFYWDDRFVALELERENVLVKGNSFFSFVFTAILIMISDNKLIYSKRLIVFWGLLSVFVFLFTRL